MNFARPNVMFHLPYNQSETFWLAVFPRSVNEPLGNDLKAAGLTQFDNWLCKKIDRPWTENWKSIRAILESHKVLESCEVALIPSGEQPGHQDFEMAKTKVSALDMLADSLWLGEAMLEDRVVSYMQPMLDKRGKVFGYEAFARVETEGGAPIGGGKIIEASKGLNAHYILDRHLHVKAVTSFISSDLEGFLFINFVPGFIHRPEKYLEGLTDAAKFQGMPAKQIVLDFTRSESPNDLTQMKAIFDYCRSKGYSLSLDDISSTALAKKILDTIRPDFIKLDIALVRGALKASEQRTIAELVSLAHSVGVTVAAEGVESQEIHNELIKAGVDLFQGYLFSPPVAVSALKKAVG
jgi:EAL domain-containing protein (putative c-di-GMP-specific phosphodiesterase class I)